MNITMTRLLLNKKCVNNFVWILISLGNGYSNGSYNPAVLLPSAPPTAGYNNQYATYPSNGTTPGQEFNPPPYTPYSPGSTNNAPYPPGPTNNAPYPPGSTNNAPYPPGPTNNAPYPPTGNVPY